MSKDMIFMVIGFVGLGSLGYCWRTWKNVDASSSENQDDSMPAQPLTTLDEQKTTLAILSQLWKEGEVKKIKFDQLAPLWRNIQPASEEQAQPVVFRHPEIMQFYQNRVHKRPFFTGGVLDATLELLRLLDDHGDCPSVVNKNANEAERKIDGNLYQALHGIPLYVHTLHVAEEVILRTDKESLVPKAVIAALAHDLGKVPAYYDRYYVSATHSFAAAAIIETLPAVRTLKYYEDVVAAVKNHHLQSDAYLDSLLIESDQAARRRENSTFAKLVLDEAKAVKEVGGAQVVGEPVAAATAAKPKATVAKTPAPKAKADKTQVDQIELPLNAAPELKPGETDPFGVSAESKDVMGVQEERARVSRKLVDISWFEPERFLLDLKQRVNTARAGERFWSALDLNGYVYVKPLLMWDVILKHSKNDDQVAIAAAYEQMRDDYIYSVVMQLKKTDGIVAAEFLNEGHFGNVFIHNPTDGKGTEMFLIPFRAEGLRVGPDRRFRTKTEMMQRTVEIALRGRKNGGGQSQ